jgi:hypothetical protein
MLRRAPLLHFLVLGGVLFGAERALVPNVDPIVFTAADVAAFRQDWTLEMQRAPTAAEESAGLQGRADEEALLREALRLGLDRTDPVVRSRLAQNLRFAEGAKGGNDEARLREAFALGMPRADVVVRRRLVEAMRERCAAQVRVSDAEVEAYIAAHPERYAIPQRYDFEQVFFASGADPETPARAALASARPRGDAFALGDSFRAQTLDAVLRDFGPAIAQALQGAEPGHWIGPLASAYGWHLLRVTRAEAPRSEVTAALRSGARYALREDRERAALQAAAVSLRRRNP